MSHNITIAGGTSKRLPVRGKYCDQDIIITATGGGGSGGELPELVSPASAKDIAAGKEAIAADGSVITGTVPEWTEESGRTISAFPLNVIEDGKLRLYAVAPQDALVRQSAVFNLAAPADSFGDATPADVPKGKTFTSASGLKQEGTWEQPIGVILPDLERPGTAADLKAGKELIDEDGNAVVGTLPDLNERFPGITISVDGNGVVEALVQEELGWQMPRKVTDHLQLPVIDISKIVPSNEASLVAHAGSFLTENLYTPGDAELVPSNIKAGVTIFRVTGTYEGETGGGGEDGGDAMDAFLQGTTTTITSNATQIKAYANYMQTALTSLTLPLATFIGDYAFYGNTNLATLNAPLLQTVNQYAFSGTKLSSLNLPAATTIGERAFEDNTSLTSLNAPELRTVDNYGFYNCTALATVYAPKVTKLDSSCFRSTKLTTADFPLAAGTLGTYSFYQTSITSVNLPLITSAGNYAFARCGSLASITLPKATSVGQYCFQNDTALTIVDLPECTTINNYAFNGCTALTTIVLRSNTLCKLSGTAAFTNTPYANGKSGGRVFVPSSLIASYQTATNWKTLFGYNTCEFVAIEGSEYDQ